MTRDELMSGPLAPALWGEGYGEGIFMRDNDGLRNGKSLVRCRGSRCQRG
jgi:hypothetical protein